MSNKILEYRQIVTLERHLKVEGHLLVEKKEKITISPMTKQNSRSKVIFIHYRSIDENYHKSTEVADSEEKETETNLNESALKDFQEYWQRHWSPQLSTDMLKKVS